MACVSVWDALQVILVFRLRFPEGSRRGHLGHHSSGPQARRVDIGDGVLGHALLFVAGIENRRAVAGADVIALPVQRGRIVDLKEEFEELAVTDPGRIEDDLDPFGMGPVPATRKVLALARLTLAELGVIELNEAFAAQALAVLRELKLTDDAAHVNPNGGAIALGHPLGMSGARLAMTAVHGLEQRGRKRALATMCVGVGQGVSLALERI